MKISIRIAAVCVASGLAYFYVHGKHFLTLEKREKKDAGSRPS